MWSRRDLLAGALVTGAAAAIGRYGWPATRSHASISTAPPYGPLGLPNADGIRLPVGFRSRVLARSGETVAGTSHTWHVAPDGGACFPTPDGGWVYVSNSEVGGGNGGTSAIRFDAAGSVIDAYTILSGTTLNCAGGATRRSTWLSCEETELGQVYECDPYRPGQGVVRPLLGAFRHEAAAEDRSTGIVYLSEDDPAGRLYRFVPASPGDLTHGRLEAASLVGTSVTWVEVSPLTPERTLATTPFDGGEGLAVDGRRLYFTTKGDGRVWKLDLATDQMTVLVDDSGGNPPGTLSGVDNLAVHEPTGDLYVAEDGDDMQLVQIVQASTEVLTFPIAQFIGHDGSEVTGPAFNPSGDRLYMSSQRGPTGTAGWTVEIVGPFRVARAPGAASISGMVYADRLGSLDVGPPSTP